MKFPEISHLCVRKRWRVSLVNCLYLYIFNHKYILKESEQETASMEWKSNYHKTFPSLCAVKIQKLLQKQSRTNAKSTSQYNIMFLVGKYYWLERNVIFSSVVPKFLQKSLWQQMTNNSTKNELFIRGWGGVLVVFLRSRMMVYRIFLGSRILYNEAHKMEKFPLGLEFLERKLYCSCGKTLLSLTFWPYTA